jgi:hypothetical protein
MGPGVSKAVVLKLFVLEGLREEQLRGGQIRKFEFKF